MISQHYLAYLYPYINMLRSCLQLRPCERGSGRCSDRLKLFPPLKKQRYPPIGQPIRKDIFFCLPGKMKGRLASEQADGIDGL